MGAMDVCPFTPLGSATMDLATRTAQQVAERIGTELELPVFLYGKAARREDRLGVILDHACQYSHPKAPPNYSYLIRWDDGQIQAVCESAINSSHGLETVE